MYRIIFFLLTPFIALLYEGIRRKLFARFQNRIGPPILQPFYDIRKLFRKEKIKTVNDPFFKSAPFLYFLTIFALFLFVPFSLISFQYDFIILIYITILASAFYVLAGLSSDNPFGIIGSMREMSLVILYEITLALIIFNLIIREGVLSFGNLELIFPIFTLPISAIALVIIAFIELHITPFDTVEATSEIMAGSGTEYSGKGLGFMELTKYFKRLFFLFLIPLLLFGRDFWFLIVWSLIFLFIYTIIQASAPRYRVDQAIKVYFIVMFFVLLETILLMRGII